MHVHARPAASPNGPDSTDSNSRGYDTEGLTFCQVLFTIKYASSTGYRINLKHPPPESNGGLSLALDVRKAKLMPGDFSWEATLKPLYES